VPGFHAALTLHLVETSPVLRRRQAAALPGATWHDSADKLPQLPLFLIANEFFDALPIRQFQRDGDGWRERMVGLENGRLTFGLSTAAPLAALSGRRADTQDGDIVETCPALPGIVAAIGQRIGNHGGAAIIIDYGALGAKGDTLQAVQGHAAANPLDAPGQADLTAHVDFAAIAAAAAPARASRMIAQGILLERLGIGARAAALARNLDGQALSDHNAAYRRLTHPAEMGDLFQAMALFPPAADVPPGFAA
jgi:SAM-dependent MidA family methyltransferase